MMESNAQKKYTRKRRYTAESRYNEADSLTIVSKKRSDFFYIPTPKKPFHEWESQHDVNEFDDDQR